MNDLLIPINELVLPEQFAAHLRKILGADFFVNTPKTGTFSHTARGQSFFKITCPSSKSAQELCAVLKKHQISASTKLSIADGASTCTFHVPNINAARHLLEKGQLEFKASAENLLADKAKTEAAKVEQELKIQQLEALAETPSCSLPSDYFDFFGAVIDKSFFKKDHYGKNSIGFSVFGHMTSMSISIPQQEFDNDILYYTDSGLFTCANGAFYERILLGEVTNELAWAIYHNPETDRLHLYDERHLEATQQKPERFSELLGLLDRGNSALIRPSEQPHDPQ